MGVTVAVGNVLMVTAPSLVLAFREPPLIVPKLAFGSLEKSNGVVVPGGQALVSVVAVNFTDRIGSSAAGSAVTGNEKMTISISPSVSSLPCVAV